MKKIIPILLASLALSLCAYAQAPCSFAEHGVMHVGVEAGCWVFVADNGASYQPVGGPSAMYREGMAGIITGTVNTDVFTSCQQGPLMETCSFDADHAATVVGTLRYSDIEGGCWVLEAGNRTFQPLTEDASFFKDGAKVKVTGLVRPDLYTFCMMGDVLEVLTFTFIGNYTSNENGAHEAGCRADYAHCVRFCSENYCFVSCETLYAVCTGTR